MVYVTHDQLEAMTMAGRIAVMHDGRLQQFDTPDAVYNRPANRFVAGFIGTPSMNMIEGAVEGEAFLAGGARIAIDRTRFAEGHDGPRVLGIRPEAVTLGTGDLPGIVRLVENTGHEQIVTLEISGGARILARAEAGRRLNVGQSIAAGFARDAIHLFAADESGLRLNRDGADAPRVLRA